MLTIVTALYCEAEPMIKFYHLKRNNNINKFQVFDNEELRLLITNSGSITAAAGVTYISTLYPPESSDFLINIGVCAASDQSIPRGSIFLCNQITEESTGRSFYPDVIYRHPFSESSIVTCCKIRDNGENQEDNRNINQKKVQGNNQTEVKNQIQGNSQMEVKNQIPGNYLKNVKDNTQYNLENIISKTPPATMLFDMEAAGIYQAAAYFYQPHQVSFLKIISDYQSAEELSPANITEYMEKNMPEITDWFSRLKQTELADNQVFTAEEEDSIKKLAGNLQCSVTMEYKLRQMLHYHKLLHGGITEELKAFYRNTELPCKTKTEGKIYIEQLKEELI
jgi:nucleoside phosphorylase